MAKRLVVNVTHQIGTLNPLRCECGKQMSVIDRNEEELTTDWLCGCGKKWRVRDVSVKADELP